MALAWLLANPAVTAVVIGPRTAAQVADAVAAVDATLEPAVCERLDAIFPGFSQPAPEAYAW